MNRNYIKFTIKQQENQEDKKIMFLYYIHHRKLKYDLERSNQSI